ncbi:MAG: M23 family metallopeptidase [Clostridiales bacterium]|nr:M23 family metallopeptidase [Clostridiales bacterium]
MKKKITAIIVALLLFIPTYAAIAYYSVAQNAPVDNRAISKMTLTDLTGSMFEFERSDARYKDNIENNMLSYFLDLNAKASEESSLPDSIDVNRYFKAVYTAYDRETVYRYYFNNVPDNAWFIDGDGKFWHIGTEHAKKFLNSSYARCLFSGAEPPSLIMDDQPVEPRALTWEYRSYEGSFVKSADTDNSSSELPTYRVVGGRMFLDFSVEPDLVQVKVSQGGNTLFDDTYANIGNINLKENDRASITVTAKWYETAERGYRGEAVYSFTANVTAEPVFYLGETSVEPGEFIVVTGLNINEPTNVRFESSPDIGFTPVFFKEDDCVRALIPVDVNIPEVAAMTGNADTNETVNIDLTFTASGVSQTLTLVVTEKQFKAQTLGYSAATIEGTYSEAALNEYKSSLSEALSAREPNKYFDGVWTEASSDGIIRTGFGLYRTIAVTNEVVRHTGVDYLVSAGKSALAVNRGKVIYTGELTTSGKIVVIDHGWGLKSTYEHLSSISVAVGDVVAQGDIVGIVGDTGCCEGYMLHTALFVFNVPVCPYDLWEKGVVMTDPAAVDQSSSAPAEGPVIDPAAGN